MVPPGIEFVIDGERQVVLIQLDQGRAQLLTASEGLVGKLVGLELEPSGEHGHAEVEELKVREELTI